MMLPVSASAWYYDYDPYYGYYGQNSYYYYPTYYDPQTYYYPQQYYYEYPSYPAYPTYTSYYGYTSTPSPYNYSYPTGDTDTFGYDICYWEGYGRSRCDFNPRQPVYDHWTGTWY